MPKPDGSKKNPIPLPEGFVDFRLDLQSKHRGAFSLYTRASASAPWVVFKEGELTDTSWLIAATQLKHGLKYAFAWLRTADKLKVAFIVRPADGGTAHQAVRPATASEAKAGLADGEVYFT